MIYEFKVKASIYVALTIITAHSFSIGLISLFAIPVTLKLVAIVMTVISLCWQLHKWYESDIEIRYQASNQSWTVPGEGKCGQSYSVIKTVYLCDVFVWIILSSPGQAVKPVIVGVDSLESEKFLQLRRCILCPELFF